MSIRFSYFLLLILFSSCANFKKEAYIDPALLLKYKRISFTAPWDTSGFYIFNGNDSLFAKIWLDTAKTDEIRMKRQAKWAYANQRFTHETSILYNKYYQTSLLPISVQQLWKAITFELQVKDFIAGYKNKYGLELTERAEDLSDDYYDTFHFFDNYVGGIFCCSYAQNLPIYFRERELLEKIWALAKPILFAKLSRNDYLDSKLNFYVSTLLQTHKILKNQSVDFAAFKDLEEGGQGLTFEEFKTDEFYNLFSEEINQSYNKNEAKNWFLSFWYRRYIEGTIDVSYSILEELDSHYKISVDSLNNIGELKNKLLSFNVTDGEISFLKSSMLASQNFSSVLKKLDKHSLPYTIAPYFFEGLYNDPEIKKNLVRYFRKNRLDSLLRKKSDSIPLYYFADKQALPQTEDKGLFGMIDGQEINEYKLRNYTLQSCLPSLNDELLVFIALKTRKNGKGNLRSLDYELFTYDCIREKIIDRRRILTTGLTTDAGTTNYYGGLTVDIDYQINIKAYAGKYGGLNVLNRKLKILTDGTIVETLNNVANYNGEEPGYNFSL